MVQCLIHCNVLAQCAVATQREQGVGTIQDTLTMLQTGGLNNVTRGAKFLKSYIFGHKQLVKDTPIHPFIKD